MTRRNIIVFVFLLCVFAVSFLVLTFDVFGEQKPKEVLDISFVVRGKSSDSWVSMRQGAEQAASEMNVNLSFITLTEENDAQEQVGLFDREVINGADAILVSARGQRGNDRSGKRSPERNPSDLCRIQSV